MENSLSTSCSSALSDIDMMIECLWISIAMVEGEMKEISEAEMFEAIKFAHEHIKKPNFGSIAFASCFW
jgi:polyribonucleotide nucleotidyltransferase